MPYAEAYRIQVEEVERLVAARGSDRAGVGSLLVVEHPPVITVSRRAGALEHVLAPPELLADAGIELAETDRGGDVTYHGPGQLVVYPILDLNRLKLRLHEYMRLLEAAVIDALAGFGVAGRREPDATGVWVDPVRSRSDGPPPHADPAKIAAMGVRVRRWVSMHGLALNVSTSLDHFKLIVPCGLAGRPVTSLTEQLGAEAPSLEQATVQVVAALQRQIEQTPGLKAAKQARIIG